MPVLSKENFEELARFNNNPCISVFLPTQRAGHEVLNEKSRIQLKSRWKAVHEKLKDQGMRQDEIDQLGEPVEKLLDDSNFWRHQSEGLALFISKDFFRSYTLPIDLQKTTYISDHFYLKPLVPLFSDGRFYLLSLQPDNVRFFEASRYSFEQINIEDKVPGQLEDRVGYDFEERVTKHKTQNSRMGTFTQHGYAPASKDERNEILRYFRAVDKGLYDILHDQRVPLVLACQDYLYPIYEEATRYQHLFPDHVSGNPTADYTDDDKQLHQKAVEVLKPYYNKERDEKLGAFQELGPERVSSSVSEIIPALYEGKVDTLFLQNREDIWGKYNEKMASVEVNSQQQNGDVSLMNLAAVKAIEQQGKVFLVDRQFMPTDKSKICAVFRY